MTKRKATFRSEVERLEAIVRSLEENDLDLDQALELFEEGVRRLRTAREQLEQSEITVRRVLEAADGTLSTRDLDI